MYIYIYTEIRKSVKSVKFSVTPKFRPTLLAIIVIKWKQSITVGTFLPPRHKEFYLY